MITPTKVSDCSHMGIGKIGTDMSRSDECVLASECGFVHVAARAAKRGRLVVADDLQVNVQPGRREVAAGPRPTLTGARAGRQGGGGPGGAGPASTVAGERAGGGGEPAPAGAACTVADGGAVPGGPGLGGQRLDRLDEL